MSWKIKLLTMVALFGVAILGCSFAKVGQRGLITITPEITFQTINGWEATAQAGEADESNSQASPPPYVNARRSFPLYSDKLFDLAVNDLGINRVRLEIPCGAENPVDYYEQYLRGQITYDQYRVHRYETINDDDDPLNINKNGFQFGNLDFTIEQVVLPIKNKLSARGEELFVNTCNVCFHPSNSLHRANPQEYAEYVLATYEHMEKKYGFVPDSWEVLLEADNNTGGWTAVEVGQAIAAAGRLLETHRFRPRFVVPSSTDASNAPTWFDQIVTVPGALPYISEISYHRYCCATDNVLQQIGQRAIHNGINAGMLEWIGATYRELHRDLTLANNSEWSQFALAYPSSNDDGGVYYLIDEDDEDHPVIIEGSRTKFLRQYFKFIRRGAVRVGAESTNGLFSPLAFINTNDTYVVVIKADTDGSFAIQGLPAGNYGIVFTTATQSAVDVPDVALAPDGKLYASIPGAGVITVFGKPGPGMNENKPAADSPRKR